MCGIAGFTRKSGSSKVIAVEAVKLMTDRMAVRGPDADLVWSDGRTTLGHRRLAIIDLSDRAKQPMVSECGRYIIVFNGEIYNFEAIRNDLIEKGEKFRTSSDTEVLLKLFALEGQQMLTTLRGMFAFAIWDTIASELFLARDPYGIKPLYYSQTEFGLIFASQVKALLASGLISSTPESAGLAGFLLWGSVPEPWTVHRGVLALAPGHFLRVKDGVAGSPICWNDIRDFWRVEPRKLSADELRELVQKVVRDSVQAHLISDVPVSMFLSGGVDSAVVVALAAELGAQIEGITISFSEYVGKANDEAPGARVTASHYGIRLHERLVTRSEFEEDLPRILDAMDQPTIDGINTWFASKAAAERGYKVALSGIGGDELFCGYPSFINVPRLAKFGKLVAAWPHANRLLRYPCAYLAQRLANPKIAAIPTFSDSIERTYFLQRALFLPEELPSLMGEAAAAEGLARLGGSSLGLVPIGAYSDIAAVGILESTSYLRNQLLRDSDWASMAHSLELRTPLVDCTLLKALAPYVSDFANGIGKGMLGSSPTKQLPRSITHVAKTGFTLPMREWLLKSTGSSGQLAAGSSTALTSSWARQWGRQIAMRIAE